MSRSSLALPIPCVNVASYTKSYTFHTRDNETRESDATGHDKVGKMESTKERERKLMNWDDDEKKKKQRNTKREIAKRKENEY